MKNKLLLMNIVLILLCVIIFNTPSALAVSGNSACPARGSGNHVSDGSGSCTSNAKCTYCSQPIDGTTTDHDYSIAATCTSAEKCSVCGSTRGSALGHNYSSATCTEAEKCSRCGGTGDPALGHDGGFETCQHGKYCTRTNCGVEYTSKVSCKPLNANYWIASDGAQHYQLCGWCESQINLESCKSSKTLMLYSEASDDTLHYFKCTKCTNLKVDSEKHELNQGEGIDEHKCKCEYTPSESKHHGFTKEGACLDKRCSASLKVGRSSEVDALPNVTEYYMIGSGVKGWEKSISTATFEANYTPYSSCNGDATLVLTLDIASFDHGNYADHAAAYDGAHVDDDENEANTQWPVNNITKPAGEWSGYLGTIPDVTPSELTATLSGRVYTVNTFPDGHWKVKEAKVAGTTSSQYVDIYCKGGCTPPAPTKIYAYLKIEYRNVNGQTIPGAPADVRRKVVTWLEADTGDGFSETVQLSGLDSLGWRYRGFKSGTSYNVPEGLTGYDLSDSAKYNKTYSTSTSLGNQTFYVVFFFEPVKVTVNHINSDRTFLINTNKNITYELPKIISETGHNCGSLGCSNDKGKREEGRVITHNNTSLNKYLWPGYVLTDYTLKRADGHQLDAKKYNLLEDNPEEGEATTRVATSGDKLTYGDNIPKSIYQKTIPIATDINTNVNEPKTKDEVGYKQDIVLDFKYSNVDVKVSHRDYDTNEILKSKNGTDLAYIKTLNGHYFIVSSLITQGEHVLTEITPPIENGVYDISGSIIRKIEITKKNRVIWEKEFELKQDAEISLEPTKVTNLLYYIISSNDIENPELISEINRIGNDIEFKFYYEKVPMLTIKHQDELGNTLWATEYIPLVSLNTTVYSKDLTSFNYLYKEAKLDGNPWVLFDRTSPTSDIRKTNIPPNGNNDRELIIIYKENIPTLTVKYVDKDTGAEISERTVYKMEKDSISTFAKDLSGVKKAGTNNYYEYKEFKLFDGDTDTPGSPVTKSGSQVTVSVEKTNSNRLLVFYYVAKNDVQIIDPSLITSEAVILKSNYRDNEEYNVLRAIPTSEDLYANVITDSFILSNIVNQRDKEDEVYVKLIQPYYKTSNTDNAGTDIEVDDKVYIKATSDYMPFTIPYSYFSANKVQLNIISKAIVKNNSIEVRANDGRIKEIDQVTILPNYPKEPSLDYKVGGELVFEDLAKKYPTMAGKTVKEYVEGMASGEYNLKSGFYNVNKIDGKFYVEYILPEIQYTEDFNLSDIVAEYENNPHLLTKAAEDNNVRVTMDTLKVIREDDTIVTILSGYPLPLNREYTLIQLESMVDEDGKPILDATPEAPLIGRDVLYKKDEIYITKTEENIEYKTTADIWYRPRQRVNPVTLTVETINNNETLIDSNNFAVAAQNGQEILIEAKKDIPGNSVFVHTPVVNDTTIADNSKGIENNHLIIAKGSSKEDKKNILVLGQEFTIKIPNNGTHLNEPGYKTKAYNYRGLPSPGDNQVNNIYKSFAQDRQIRFTFGVIYGNTYYKLQSDGWTEWISLGVAENELFKFTAPEWEEERWVDSNHHTIETRVIAENCTDEKLAKTQNSANKDRENYVAVNSINVRLIGELRDLEIRATNDPGFSGYKTEGTAGLPLGQLGQGNGGAAYKYGIKLGYSVYFDITSTGWTGDTTEKINLTPKYYYVSKEGGNAKPVDLYYKLVGNPNYVKMEGATGARPLSTIMSTDAIRGPRCKSVFASWLNGELGKGSGFFNANAGQEMSNTSRLISALKAEATSNYLKLKNKPTINYGVAINTGNTDLITLPYSVRLAYTNAVNAMISQKYAGISGLNVVSENIKNYCIGHWYGAFKLPATTVAVPKNDPAPKPDKSNTLKDGYIIVTFEEVHSVKVNEPNEIKYLEVGPERYAQEGADTEFTLPNGKPGNIPSNPVTGVGYIPVAIYETNIAMNQDAEVGGTH